LRGYEYSIEKAGLSFDKSLVFEGDFTRKTASKLFSQIMSQNVDAIFASNDEGALGILEAARRDSLNGRFIPVVGFDDAVWAQFIQPPLTTVRQPMYQLGRLAGHTITESLSQKVREHVRLTLNTRLVVRRSCGC